ncbi:plasmid stabilization protein [Streptomyces hygroscopicus subsp. limoneus]|nr:plasmid stabilization protein [Streptomyces hygroscopicus subsp. limoneus]ALO98683.1 plasmid stabilization protein [Streptomyces hygroscopicus subsp. limoneus]ALP00183.1 plasmid stabilization protein [Streptomyces hygroscopicus subsp. limoneus]
MSFYTVKIGSDRGLLAFEPKELALRPGNTIEWVCNKLGPHNVVFDPARVPGGDAELAKALSCTAMMSAGQTATTVLPADAPTGDYRFYCATHRGASGAGKLTVH